MAFFRATFFHRFTFYLTCNDKIIKITEIYIVTQLRQDFPRTLSNYYEFNILFVFPFQFVVCDFFKTIQAYTTQ